MACTSATISTIDGRCSTAIGGIKCVLVANKDDVTDVSTNEQGLITQITMADTKKFAKWQFRKNTGSYTSTFSTDTAIGNNTVTTEVNLQFTRAEQQKRMDLQTALNAAAVVIIEDMLGNYLYLGFENEVTITNLVMQSGTQTSDLNGFTLTFTDIAQELPHFVDSSIISGLVTA